MVHILKLETSMAKFFKMNTKTNGSILLGYLGMFEKALDISHHLNNIKLNEFVSIVQKVMLVLGHFHVFVA